MKKIKIGVSACLLGKKVRYDGNHKLDRYIIETMGRHFRLVGVCPEVEYGLGVPREPMHLVGDPANPGLVTNITGIDHTEGMRAWVLQRVRELEAEGLAGFIFKSRSPSCGMQGVEVDGKKEGMGLFARAVMECLPDMPVVEEVSLDEMFIERIYAYCGRTPGAFRA